MEKLDLVTTELSSAMMVFARIDTLSAIEVWSS